MVKKPVTVWLEPWEIARLDEIGEKLDRGRSYLIREAVLRHFNIKEVRK